MPQINRVRVNNVKYNFGTQFYDDFIMRFNCRNTIYDLANGGGKSLLMLLPFYIMRYEKRGHEMSEDPQLFQELLNEYEVIRSKLEVEITESGRSELFSDLIGLITRISDHIFRNEEKVRKGIGEIMGGKVLELESERLKAEGMIAGAIKTCKKFKLDQEASVKNIMEEFSLSEEEASNYVKKYW